MINGTTKYNHKVGKDVFFLAMPTNFYEYNKPYFFCPKFFDQIQNQGPQTMQLDQIIKD